MHIQENSRLDISRKEGLGTTIGLVKIGSHSRISKYRLKNLKKKHEVVHQYNRKLIKQFIVYRWNLLLY
jgi:hypothetical protein